MAPQAQALSFIKEKHRLTLASGQHLEVFVRRPAMINRKVPAIILFGGFNTGAEAISLFDPPEPVYLVSFQYPFQGPRKFVFPRDLHYVPKAREALHVTIQSMHQLVKWVSQWPQIDSKRIILAGASFGAPFVSIVAGNDPAVSGLILIHGFADIPAAVAFSLGNRWRPKLGRFADPLAWLTGHFLWWLTGLEKPEDSLARMRASQRVLLLTAAQDDLLPPRSVAALRTALSKSAAIWQEKTLPGTHMRPGEKIVIDSLLDESISWLKHNGLL